MYRGQQGRAWIAVAAAALTLGGCAGRDARDFGGRWLPANTWPADTTAMPLRPAHVFQATPMDGTLRTLLARWARDSGGALDYRHPDDFTLHRPVAGVHARDLAAAVAQLADAFAGEGVAMRVEDGRIVVDAAADANGGTP